MTIDGVRTYEAHREVFPKSTVVNFVEETVEEVPVSLSRLFRGRNDNSRVWIDLHAVDFGEGVALPWDGYNEGTATINIGYKEPGQWDAPSFEQAYDVTYSVDQSLDYVELPDGRFQARIDATWTWDLNIELPGNYGTLEKVEAVMLGHPYGRSYVEHPLSGTRIPEPTTLAMAAMGLVGCVTRRKRGRS